MIMDFILIDFYRYLRQQGEDLNLAQIYVTLETIPIISFSSSE